MSNHGRMTRGQTAALIMLARLDANANHANGDTPQVTATGAELRAAGASQADIEWLLKNNLVRLLTSDGEITEQARFALTYGGRLLARSEADSAARRAKQRLAAKQIEWRPEEYVLLVGGRPARRFKRRAPAQWAILDRFAARKWRGPVEIRLNCDGRDPSHRLREIISDLNEGSMSRCCTSNSTAKDV